mmetsp:Transcript_5931/g.13148  ORF Transcript_5931/g.13148 Transcript_5931/m.13148 type:complete len:216 (-) Transcript_5931:392-1039(-)
MAPASRGRWSHFLVAVCRPTRGPRKPAEVFSPTAAGSAPPFVEWYPHEAGQAQQGQRDAKTAVVPSASGLPVRPRGSRRGSRSASSAKTRHRWRASLAEPPTTLGRTPPPSSSLARHPPHPRHSPAPRSFSRSAARTLRWRSRSRLKIVRPRILARTEGVRRSLWGEVPRRVPRHLRGGRKGGVGSAKGRRGGRKRASQSVPRASSAIPEPLERR